MGSPKARSNGRTTIGTAGIDLLQKRRKRAVGKERLRLEWRSERSQKRGGSLQWREENVEGSEDIISRTR